MKGNRSERQILKGVKVVVVCTYNLGFDVGDEEASWSSGTQKISYVSWWLRRFVEMDERQQSMKDYGYGVEGRVGLICLTMIRGLATVYIFQSGKQTSYREAETEGSKLVESSKDDKL